MILQVGIARPVNVSGTSLKVERDTAGLPPFASVKSKFCPLFVDFLSLLDVFLFLFEVGLREVIYDEIAFVFQIFSCMAHHIRRVSLARVFNLIFILFNLWNPDFILPQSLIFLSTDTNNWLETLFGHLLRDLNEI